VQEHQSDVDAVTYLREERKARDRDGMTRSSANGMFEQI
jgi:hypothetical protein